MLDLALLGMLRDGPDHGYRLGIRFRSVAGAAWKLNRGAIYLALRSLLDGSCVAILEDVGTEQPHDTNKKRDRRRYALTEKGEVRIREWLRRPPAEPRPLRPEIVSRLAALGPQEFHEAIRQLDMDAIMHERFLERLQADRNWTATRQTPSEIGSLIYNGAVGQIEAHLAWVEAAKERLHLLASAQRSQSRDGADEPVSPSSKRSRR